MNFGSCTDQILEPDKIDDDREIIISVKVNSHVREHSHHQQCVVAQSEFCHAERKRNEKTTN